ncbi:hypothetical protein AJ85_00385 [Alkalihalobacillus alcalophilus ATCC 27647 = CGMCC 1.3604]|uniref:N-acetyltransferase domain-containing protein n=1 Tax=Alkalihalobacillus alcalophilus ATCC 27647 = CGMCC 1.3604 TaxID=1218173 RepID=A0A094WE94_ALKAL|nr:GNAT family protein [Alkalihalobacillus alcalophilus]KGA96074.1 hypothetical protein BALCAV_0218505 [Alkalihalobacillus alcalophilus ATCC 27647 = CGMCC 1.3604]MED1562409.1 GNAT family protein [Alkalihalobacillus alcalophilus]THG88714.1 hypothetical protein AJ85_00385 [Alkalihalobacillus alcalophilus ATCC 27647 = CGMCC 1.3604]
MTVAYPFFYHLPQLTTLRTRLRKVEDADRLDLISLSLERQSSFLSDEQIVRTKQESNEYVDYLLNCYKKGRPAPWGIFAKESNRLIGVCGYVKWLPKEGAAEIGYQLDPIYWKRGLMTEVVQEVIDFSFNQLGLCRIDAKCLANNFASIKLLHKVGMIKQEQKPSYVWSKGHYEMVEFYSIGKDKFRSENGV